MCLRPLSILENIASEKFMQIWQTNEHFLFSCFYHCCRFKELPKYVRIADTFFSTVSRTQSSCRKVPFDALPRSVLLAVFSLELIALTQRKYSSDKGEEIILKRMQPLLF